MTVGVLTPMANPTVEAEFRQILPAELHWVTARLVSDIADPLERLRAYAEEVGDTLRDFDVLPLAAVAFACTGSSYLIGRDREAEIAAALPAPLLWATDAILYELAVRSARRIAVVSPYPPALHAAGLAYWRAAGLDVVHAARVDIGSADTRAIYGLGADAARDAVATARSTGCDAVLLSGTGMPTLAHVDPDGSPPVLSSNLCLARALIRAAETGDTP